MLKDAARTHFKEYYKFKKGEAEETKTYNKELRATLLSDDAFHYKVSLRGQLTCRSCLTFPIFQDFEAGVGYAESPIIADIIETALFEDVSGYGVKFSNYFKPIPLNLLALVITIVRMSLFPFIWNCQLTSRMI